MIPANVNIEIDQKQVREFIERELQKQIHQQLILVDIVKLSEVTCMSPRHLENEILHDPRVKIHERKQNRKRWWIAQPTFKAIVDITNDW